ncbi:MAG TPA: sodium:calcium antiporter, partial [Polyangia bacterium]
MSGLALLSEFVASLGLVSISGYVLTGQIERLGARLDFTPGLLGLVVALGADSPEIASAVSALIHGRTEVGAGVVFGSNIFNIAGLLGVGAIV